MNDVLRNKLNEMTKVTDVDKHLAVLENLRSEFNHAISLTKSDFPIESYRCIVQAFYLNMDERYKKIDEITRFRMLNSDGFVFFLLLHNLLKPINATNAKDNDLVIYFDFGKFVHIGRVVDNSKIISKWGWGNIYTHPIWEVPTCFGKEVRYYSGPSQIESFNLFIHYAKNWGVFL